MVAKLWVLFALFFFFDPWITAVVAFIVVAWLLDRLRLRVLPDLWQLWRRRQRKDKLRRRLEINPHDRSARFEFAELLVDTGRGGQALPLLEANIRAGDDDAEHRLLAGRAAAALGSPSGYGQARAHLEAGLARDRNFRSGALSLELGRCLVASGDLVGARSAIDAALRSRPGSLDARAILVRIVAANGDGPTHADLRRETATLFSEAPLFERRKQWRSAWTVVPRLRVAYLAMVFGSASAVAFAVYVVSLMWRFA